MGFSIVALLMVGGITATGIKEHRYGGDILKYEYYTDGITVAPLSENMTD